VAEQTQRTPTAGAFAVSFLLVELSRVLLPTLLVVLPEDRDVPLGTALGWATLVLVAVPLVAGTLAGRWPRWTWVGATATLLVARGGVLVGSGLEVRVGIGAIGVAAGLTALVALAAGSPSGRAVRVGILLGIGAEAIVRAASGGGGLVWSTSVPATWTSLALLALLGVLIAPTGDRLLAPEASSGPPAWPWWWLLPAVVLTSTLTAPAGRLAVATGWPPAAVAATSAAVQGAAVLAALLAPRLAPTRAALLGATSILVGSTAALTASGWTGVLGPLLTAVGLGAIAGLLAGAGQPSTGKQRARVAGIALAGAGAVLLLHALGPDLGLPVNRRLLLLTTAIIAVALTAIASRRAAYVTVRSRIRPAALVAVLLIAGGVAAAAALTAATGSTPVPASPDERLTVATFHIRSGFGTDGRFDPGRQAELLTSEAVNVVFLNEVDRGSWLTGGQDALPVLAAGLGLEHVAFVPSADEVHGHALLSRFPIVELASTNLPGEPGHPTRSQVAAILALGEERPLGIVGAQLLPGGDAEEVRLAQARALAGTVARLRARELPTVVLGDLGTRDGTAALDSFDALVTTALPENSTTYPSWAPTDQRDHVLLSPELRRSTVATPATTSSSHLPVVVTVEFRSPGL
jgi:endonuclease/exonuclease/phosphatase family metal-dependent hydrolase